MRITWFHKVIVSLAALGLMLAISLPAAAQGSIIGITKSSESVEAGSTLTIDYRYSGAGDPVEGLANINGTVVSEIDGPTDVGGGVIVTVVNTGAGEYQVTIEVPADYPGDTIDYDLTVLAGPSDYDAHTPTTTSVPVTSIPDPGDGLIPGPDRFSIAGIGVDKFTIPAGAPDVFDFTFIGPNGVPVLFGLADGGLQDFFPLDPGIYTVTETVPPGWTLVSVACDALDVVFGFPGGVSVSTVNLGAGSVTIDLKPDEFVICVFTNAQDDDDDDGAATPPPTGIGGGADTGDGSSAGDGGSAGGPPTALPTTGSAGLADQNAGGLSGSWLASWRSRPPAWPSPG